MSHQTTPTRAIIERVFGKAQTSEGFAYGKSTVLKIKPKLLKAAKDLHSLATDLDDEGLESQEVDEMAETLEFLAKELEREAGM